MFSTATVTALLFVVFLAGLGIMIWIDGKKKYVLPPKLNYEEGGEECSEENASAEHKTRTKNGDLIARVSANDQGKASTWAALGYEHQNEDSDEKKLIVELNFKYRIKLDSDNEQSTVCAKIETFMNDQPVKIAEQRLPAPAAANEGGKSGDDFISGKQRHIVLLRAGENFTTCLKISLEAEASSGGKCNGEIVANLSEIWYRPELKPL
jgi:hypothetical protein